jgi:hypothetical protein
MVNASDDIVSIGDSKVYLPVLKQEIIMHWQALPRYSILAGQVEQESRWKAKAARDVGKEHGAGLAQITKVDGRFDNYLEARKLHPSLKSWDFEDRFNPIFQLRTMVLLDKQSFNKVSWATNPENQISLMLVTYNSGYGNLLVSRQLCRLQTGCNENQWWGNLEHHGKQSKTPWAGGTRSPWSVSREYPVVIETKSKKYISYLGS